MLLYWILLPIVWVLAHILFRFEVIGRENLKAVRDGRAYVIAPNHIANLDPVLIAITIFDWKRLRILAKEELFKNPLAGWFLRCMGAVSIERGKGDTTTVEKLTNECKNGTGIMIFPEGTRTKTGKLGVIKSGAFVIAAASGADMLPVDVMDGAFVPNLTIGVPVVQSIRRCTDMFLDVHLMIEKPVRYIEAFAKAGADLLSIHLEADHPTRIAQALKVMGECGVKKAVALRPITKAEAILPYLEELDLVLVMTVEPGCGGQAFMESQLDTIRQVRALIERYNPACELEVDGGISPKTAPLVVEAGANVLVAGSAVFRRCDRAAAITAIRNA